jgi:hypothetical protein
LKAKVAIVRVKSFVAVAVVVAEDAAEMAKRVLRA